MIIPKIAKMLKFMFDKKVFERWESHNGINWKCQKCNDFIVRHCDQWTFIKSKIDNNYLICILKLVIKEEIRIKFKQIFNMFAELFPKLHQIDNNSRKKNFKLFVSCNQSIRKSKLLCNWIMTTMFLLVFFLMWIILKTNEKYDFMDATKRIFINFYRNWCVINRRLYVTSTS